MGNWHNSTDLACGVELMHSHQDKNSLVRLGPRKALLVLLVGLAGLGAVGLLDWAITTEVSVSSFYLLPVALVAWYVGRTAGLTMSFLAAGVWFLVESDGGSDDSGRVASSWQAASRLIFYLVTAFLVSRIRVLAINLETEIVQRKELEREAAEITEQEQERVAHELHDQLAVYLAEIAFRAKTVGETLDRRSAPEAIDARNLATSVNGASDRVRAMARLLEPARDTNGDLAVALTRLGAEVKTGFGITCLVQVPKEFPKLTEEQLGQLYRIAQEALRNAIQHAQAELVKISVSLKKENLKLSVICHGKASGPSHPPITALGLRIMRYRTGRLRGTLSVESSESGETLVTCEVPIGIPAPRVQGNGFEQKASGV